MGVLPGTLRSVSGDIEGKRRLALATPLAKDGQIASTELARQMRKALEAHPDRWALRVGIHRGEVVAGVIGGERFQFDIFGDVVNLASRLCDSGRSNSVCVSRASIEPSALPQGTVWEEEETAIKGAGSMTVVHIRSV